MKKGIRSFHLNNYIDKLSKISLLGLLKYQLCFFLNFFCNKLVRIYLDIEYFTYLMYEVF